MADFIKICYNSLNSVIYESKLPEKERFVTSINILWQISIVMALFDTKTRAQSWGFLSSGAPVTNFTKMS
jgi:hypothetical protein